MKDEVTTDDLPTNGDEPATQADLATLAGEMTRRFNSVDQRLTGLEQGQTSVDQKLTSLEQGQASILSAVESIDKRLQAWKDIPERMERVEKAAFPTG